MRVDLAIHRIAEEFAEGIGIYIAGREDGFLCVLPLVGVVVTPGEDVGGLSQEGCCGQQQRETKEGQRRANGRYAGAVLQDAIFQGARQQKTSRYTKLKNDGLPPPSRLTLPQASAIETGVFPLHGGMILWLKLAQLAYSIVPGKVETLLLHSNQGGGAAQYLLDSVAEVYRIDGIFGTVLWVQMRARGPF